MEQLLEFVLQLVLALFDADSRPEARRFSIGGVLCLALVLGLSVIVFLNVVR